MKRLIGDAWVEYQFAYAAENDYKRGRMAVRHVAQVDSPKTVCGRNTIWRLDPDETDTVSDIHCTTCRTHILLKTL